MQLVFALTLFISATLLFLVQPMFAKMVLPLLGGTPNVWNTCMMFYQAALLGGYVYAHLGVRWLGPRRQSILHLAVLCLPWLVLPVAIPDGWRPPVQSNPIPAMLLLLGVSVGLPFFVVSATAPMLQAWFAETDHPSARDPYYLYAASNLGSILALVGYPVVVEPLLPLAAQAWMWAAGYGVLGGLIFLCVLLLRRSARAAAPQTLPAAVVEAEVAPPAWWLRLRWVALALAPSSLMLGVTTHVATDVASVPMLWVIPLTLYLLTFVLVFAKRPPLPHRWMVRIQPIVILLLAAFFLLYHSRLAFILVPLHLLTFFVMAMVCHGELAATRPHTRYLTEFYLWMSVGGVLGGLINAVAAPLLFNSVLEYPLMILAGCLLRPLPAATGPRWRRWLGDLLWPALMAGAAAVAVWLLLGKFSQYNTLWTQGILLAVACLAVLAFSVRPVRFGLGVACVMGAAAMLVSGARDVLFQGRSFFGVIRVTDDGFYHRLSHGSTLHGVQAVDEDERGEPLSYYGRRGPLGQVFKQKAESASFHRVAAIGLGSGTIACYGLPGLRITFYEIDPLIVRVARDPELFTYLGDSRGKIDVVLGDARLTLADAPRSHYDLIVVDAFSSDAIPVHLLTREALEVYLDKLAPKGILAIHVSNRYMKLAPMVGRLAADAGLVARVQDFKPDTADEAMQVSSTEWVILARNMTALGDLPYDSRWKVIEVPPGTPLWTDDFSNILGVLSWQK